jgi:hypothetical protein
VVLWGGGERNSPLPDYENDQEMPEHEQEHVRNMIMQGYSSGQLVDDGDDTNTGWWDIIN